MFLITELISRASYITKDSSFPNWSAGQHN